MFLIKGVVDFDDAYTVFSIPEPLGFLAHGPGIGHTAADPQS